MELTRRQEAILGIVKAEGPITSEQIAERLKLARATLRPDLAILTMAGLLEARPRVGYYYSGKSLGEVVASKIRRFKVRDIQSRPVVVGDQLSVYDAIITMFLEDVGTIFVVREKGLLEGVISRKDLLKVALGAQDIRVLPVSVVMTRMPKIITTSPDELAWEAARKLVVHEIDALPVVEPADDPAGALQVVGRFSKTNATRLFVEIGERR
ncbi:MAG: helix-turn-helix transcriptional regulator [Bacillota bacterium]|nr:helix-turn-helix transcriptional regulator [Thermoanaerobacteraceae bacterium]